MSDNPAVHPSADVPTPSRTDAELIQAVRAGQVSALGVLYDRYSKLVYGLALRVLTNPEEAEDLTQEIFLILWRRQTYDPQRGSLSSFLVTLTRSRAIDRLRSRGSRHRMMQRLRGIVGNETRSNLPLENISTWERSQLVKAALVELPEKERTVLEIAYFEGLSQSEISERLDIPLGTVKTRSRQGLIKLRQALQDYV